MSSSHPPFAQLQLLGPVRLFRNDGQPGGPPLTQPRRVAIVVYLVLARPRGLQSRDTLMALLWPEADQSHGRHALRNALHAIRQALGDDAIVTAGDDFVGVNPECIECDALHFEEEVGARQFDRALARFDGEPMQGFHVSEAPDFEHWLDGQRARLRAMAVTAAWAHADALRAAGDSAGAIAAAHRAHGLARDDERSLRRLLSVLGAAGDRAAALRAYRDFAERLKRDYGVAPARETQGILALLPAGDSPPPTAMSEPISVAAPAFTPPSPPPLAFLTAAEGEAPPIRPRSRSSWAGRAFAGAAVTAALALLPYLRASRAEPQRGPESEAAAARRDAVVLGDGLAERFRTDTALFQRYLRAEAALQAARYRPARDSFQAIVEDAPLYAPAWAGLSTALSLSGFDELPPKDALPLSLAAARRALALDSTLVHAKSSVIAYDLAARWDLPAAKRGLDAALARHPDEPQLNELLATWHRWRGELDEALELRRKVYRLNPLRPSYAQSVAGTLYLSHRCAESVEVLRRMMMDFPQTASATANLYKSYRCLDRTDEAAAALAEQLRLQGDTALAARLDPPMPAARRDSMLRTVVHAQLTRLLERRRRGWVPSRTIALKYAELGDADSTLAWMDSMYVERSMSLHTVPFDPLFDFLRGDARYRAFVAKLPWNPRLAPIATR